MSEYYKAGTKGDDVLSSSAEEQMLMGMGGNDVLTASSFSADTMAAMFGGSGNDTYVLNMTKGMAIVADYGGGNDTLVLPFTTTQIKNYVSWGESGHGVVDNKHYMIVFNDDFSLAIWDYKSGGRIEQIQFSDGQTGNLDTLVNLLGRGNLRYVSSSELDIDLSMVETGVGILAKAEAANANVEVPAWFDRDTYIERHYAKFGGSQELDDHEGAFLESGFVGAEGEFRHFQQYGQWEGASPMALFDADYYFRSKAADYNNISVSRVSDAQALEMKTAISDAGMSAWSHYQLYGSREGIDASAQFDTSAYMEAKLQQMRHDNSGYTMEQLQNAFAEAGLSAAAHYQAYGKAEGLTAVGVPTSMMADVLDAGA